MRFRQIRDFSWIARQNELLRKSVFLKILRTLRVMLYVSCTGWVAACSSTSFDVGNPVFEFMKDCSGSEKNLKLKDSRGNVRLFSDQTSDTRYHLKLSGEDCDVTFNDTSEYPSSGPILMQISTLTDIRKDILVVNGMNLEPFGSLEFMQSYADRFLMECERTQLSQEKCTENLADIATGYADLNFLVRTDKGFDAHYTVKILNGSIFYMGEKIL